MNLKDLIAIKALPTDKNGNALVLQRGSGGFARISPVFAEGDFPLIGVGPAGYPCQWDADGNTRPDALGSIDVILSDDEIDFNSLVTPPSVESVEYLVLDEEDTLVGNYETEDAARSVAMFPNDQIIRATQTTFLLPDGFAHGVEMEPVTFVDAL